MRIRIPEPSAWRPNAATLLHFGEYRVPEDISVELAERALAEGAAALVKDDVPEQPEQPVRAKRKP